MLVSHKIFDCLPAKEKIPLSIAPSKAHSMPYHLAMSKYERCAPFPEVLKEIHTFLQLFEIKAELLYKCVHQLSGNFTSDVDSFLKTDTPFEVLKTIFESNKVSFSHQTNYEIVSVGCDYGAKNRAPTLFLILNKKNCVRPIRVDLCCLPYFLNEDNTPHKLLLETNFVENTTITDGLHVWNFIGIATKKTDNGQFILDTYIKNGRPIPIEGFQKIDLSKKDLSQDADYISALYELFKKDPSNFLIYLFKLAQGQKLSLRPNLEKQEFFLENIKFAQKILNKIDNFMGSKNQIFKLLFKIEKKVILNRFIRNFAYGEGKENLILLKETEILTMILQVLSHSDGIEINEEIIEKYKNDNSIHLKLNDKEVWLKLIEFFEAKDSYYDDTIKNHINEHEICALLVYIANENESKNIGKVLFNFFNSYILSKKEKISNQIILELYQGKFYPNFEIPISKNLLEKIKLIPLKEEEQQAREEFIHYVTKCEIKWQAKHFPKTVNPFLVLTDEIQHRERCDTPETLEENSEITLSHEDTFSQSLKNPKIHSDIAKDLINQKIMGGLFSGIGFKNKDNNFDLYQGKWEKKTKEGIVVESFHGAIDTIKNCFIDGEYILNENDKKIIIQYKERKRQSGTIYFNGEGKYPVYKGSMHPILNLPSGAGIIHFNPFFTPSEVEIKLDEKTNTITCRSISETNNFSFLFDKNNVPFLNSSQKYHYKWNDKVFFSSGAVGEDGLSIKSGLFHINSERAIIKSLDYHEKENSIIAQFAGTVQKFVNIKFNDKFEYDSHNLIDVDKIKALSTKREKPKTNSKIGGVAGEVHTRKFLLKNNIITPIGMILFNSSRVFFGNIESHFGIIYSSIDDFSIGIRHHMEPKIIYGFHCFRGRVHIVQAPDDKFISHLFHSHAELTQDLVDFTENFSRESYCNILNELYRYILLMEDSSKRDEEKFNIYVVDILIELKNLFESKAFFFNMHYNLIKRIQKLQEMEEL